MTARFAALGFCLLLLLAGGVALAAEPAVILGHPLTESLRLRKGGPVPLEVELTNRGPGIAEGRLEATVLFRARHASVERSGELVLVPGKRLVALPLPPPAEVQDGDQLGVQLRWLGKTETVKLGDFALGTYGFSSNELILAVGRTERSLTELDVERVRSVALENLRPRINTAGWQTFSTLPVPLPVERLPVQPLGWCAYDSVFLDTAAFSAMTEKQLTSLARWIEAGGVAFISICDPGFAPLAERHAAFLNRLAAAKGAPFRLDGAVLGTAAELPGKTLLLEPVLGRVCVQLVPVTSKDELQHRFWLVAVGWLGKLTNEQMDSVRLHGAWSEDRLFQQVPADQADLDTWLWTDAIGYSSLSPDKPRPLPLAMVALLLGTLLFAVGPADWFVLGWLRRRRWTWILLPLCCGLAAWWASWLAARTIGRTDRAASVTVTDVAPGGQVLRAGRCDMLLPSRDREWVVSARDGFVVPLPRLTAGGETARSDSGEMTGEWKTPSLFEYRRNLRQWAPSMTLSVSFPDSSDETGIPWGQLLSEWNALDWGERRTRAFTHGGWQIVMAFNFEIYGQIPESSPLPLSVLVRLAGSPFVSTIEALTVARSPLLSGIGALQANSTVPLVALAWKQDGHDLRIVRYHYAKTPPKN